jgi:hypothetical protein
MVVSCTSLMTNEVEHFFPCAYLTSVHFLWWSVCLNIFPTFYRLNIPNLKIQNIPKSESFWAPQHFYSQSLWIRDTQPTLSFESSLYLYSGFKLFIKWIICKYFLSDMLCLLILLTIHSIRNFKMLIKFILSIYYFMNCALVLYLRSICLIHGYKGLLRFLLS